MIRCRWPRGIVVAVCPILWRIVAPTDVNRTMTGLLTVSPSLKFVNCGPAGDLSSVFDAASVDQAPITTTTRAAILWIFMRSNLFTSDLILTQTDGRRKHSLRNLQRGGPRPVSDVPSLS